MDGTLAAIVELEAEAVLAEATGDEAGAWATRGIIEGLRDGTLYVELDGAGERMYGLSEWLDE